MRDIELGVEMHNSAKRAIARFYNDPKYKDFLDSYPVADIGAPNINGARSPDIKPKALLFGSAAASAVSVHIERLRRRKALQQQSQPVFAG
jgi:hypothetical protein